MGIKMTVTGDAIVVSTGVSKKDFDMLQVQDEKALTLREKNEDDVFEPVFTMAYKATAGSLDSRALVCNGTDSEGNLIATMTMPGLGAKKADAAKAELANLYATGIARANKLAAQLSKACKDVAAAETKAAESITISG